LPEPELRDHRALKVIKVLWELKAPKGRQDLRAPKATKAIRVRPGLLARRELKE